MFANIITRRYRFFNATLAGALSFLLILLSCRYLSAYAAEDCSVVVDSASNTVPSPIFTVSDSAEVGIFKEAIRFSMPSGSLLRTIEENKELEQPLVIDNDETVELKETIQYKELPTDDGKTRIIAGAQFPVVICSQINSKTAKTGDVLEAS